MKYIKNNTDNVIKIKCLSNGKEVFLTFLKNSTTAVEDTVDTLFCTLTAYTKLFTDNVLSYTTKETEYYDDDFTSYLKKFSFDKDTSILTLVFKETMAGESAVVKFSSDGEDIQEASFNLPETASPSVEINVEPAEEYVEFRVYNDYYTDFAIAYSKRIKVYV